MKKMKKFTIKRIFAYAILRKLKAIPPKMYPSTQEIKTTVDSIIPALKGVTSEYQTWLDEAEVIHRQLRRKAIDEKEGKNKLEKIRKSWDAWSDEHGEEMVTLDLEPEVFDVLQDQFERDDKQSPVWGMSWLDNVEEYSELAKAFIDAE